MSRATIALAACALLALGSPHARAQSTGLDRATWDLEASVDKTRECKAATMARCWYLFFAINEAPVRQLWLLDLKARNPEPRNANLIEMDVAHVHESDDPAEPGANDFVLMTLQFQCKEKKYRIADGYALLLNGTVDHSKEPFPWHDAKDTWFELAGKAACQKKVQLRPTDHDMVFVGDFYRPVDVVDVARRILWKQP
jgi:hypothetical protein